MVHHSGQSAAGRHSWVAVLVRVLAPVPVLAFLGLAVWSAIGRYDSWLYGLGVGVVGAVSYLPVAVSAYAGRYDLD